MDLLCIADTCPVILSGKCVFYEGDTLVYTGIGNNDTLLTALEKIDAAIGLAGGGGGILSAVAPITYSGGIISTLINTNRLIGRSSIGTGVMQEIVIGSGLTLGGGVLSATAISAIWGNISGTITNQTDLINYLSGNYYPLNSNPAGYLTSFTELDPVFTAWLAGPPDLSEFNNDLGYLTTAVLDVTASAPLSSSGGTNPNITITQANSITDGYISATDWNTFNNKQATLVSGVNIKTVNGESLLGSGDIAIAAGDSGGFKRTFLLMGA